MTCKKCGSTIGKVSGKSGEYFSCLGVKIGKCDNKVNERQNVLEKLILHDVKQLLSDSGNIQRVLENAAKKMRKLYSEFPNKISRKEKELASEERKLNNSINFIGEGNGTQSLNHALIESENKIDELKNEISVLQTSHAKVIQMPLIEWIEDRLVHIQKLLEQNVSESAMVLRKLLGPIELEPVFPESSRSYYVAHTTLETISIADKKIAPDSSEKSANQYYWRPQGDSNPRRQRERLVS